MQVNDCMHTEVTTVTPDTLVSAADQAMRRRRVRHLPVVTEQHTLVGVLTDRDLRRAEASDASPMAAHELPYLLDQLHVRNIMTLEVVTVRSTTPIEEAGQIFLQKKFGCLPVVRDDNTLAGIITVTDLLCAYVTQHDPGRSMVVSVRAMMHRHLITAQPNMSLADAQQRMRDSHIRHLPVMSKNRLVGLITDRDLRDASPSPATTLTSGEIAYHLATTPVKQCMTTDVAWIPPDLDMVQATSLLLQGKFGCLPVMDQGVLVGMITEMDCLRAFLDTVGASQA